MSTDRPKLRSVSFGTSGEERERWSGLSRQRSEDRTVCPSDEQEADYQALRRARAALFCAKVEVERLENKLKVAFGAAANLEGLATWPTLEKRTLNLPLFKREQRPMYEPYQRVTCERRFKLL